MKLYYSILILGMIFLTGCGPEMAKNVDPQEAGQALKTALTAWKDGKTGAELESQNPSILMNESDWSSGNRLLEFKMNDTGVIDGRQVKWVVQIKMQPKNGKAVDRKATYIIDTLPRIVIVRDSFAS